MSTRPSANKFTSARAILAILEWIEARGTVTVDLVKGGLPATDGRLGVRVSDKQARDYLALLVERGLIKAIRRGRTDEYHFVRDGKGGAEELTEAVGTEFAVAALSAMRGTAFHDRASKHVQTLRQSLRAAQGPRAARLRSAFYAVPASVPINSEHAAIAEEILEAIMHGHALRATYERLSDGAVGNYVLRPLWVRHQAQIKLSTISNGGSLPA